MREILFKAKRIDNGKLVEGYLFDNGFDGEEKKYFIGGLIIEKYNETACDEWDITGIDFCEINPETICQFTGLKDKNGNMVFENDIMSAHLDDIFPEDITYAMVTWENTGYCLREKESIDIQPLEENDMKYFTVCGNIFDNPELLEQEW